MSERYSMRKIREVLRLKHTQHLSQRDVAKAVGIARSTVGEYLERAKAAELTWQEAEKLCDAEVEERLFRDVGKNEPLARAPVDFEQLHVRGGDVDADPRRFRGLDGARARVLRGGAGDAGAGPTQERGQDAGPVRAGDQRDLCGDGAALRHGGGAGAPAQ